MINVVIDMSTTTDYNITGRWLPNTARITNTSPLANSNIFCFWCIAASSNCNAIATSWLVVRRHNRRISHPAQSQQTGNDGSCSRLT